MKKHCTYLFALLLTFATSVSAFAGNGVGEWIGFGPDNGRAQEAVLDAPYPNPAVNFVYLRYELPSMPGDGTLQVYSLIGQQVKTIHLDHQMGEVEISTYDLKSGIYFVYLVVDGKKVTSRKMVVSH